MNDEKDMVNSPPHYSGSIECIDAMVSAFGDEAVKIYAKLNAFKYLWRAGKKVDAEEDVMKSIWYTRFSVGDDPRKDLL
jgi:hypothetical protein